MFSLRHRLVLVNALVFLLTLIVLVGVITGNFVVHLYEQIDGELAQNTRHVIERMTAENRPARTPFDDRDLPGDSESKGFLRLLDAQGVVLSGIGAFQDIPVLSKSLIDRERGTALNQRSDDGQLLRVLTQPVYETPNSRNSTKIGYVQAGVIPTEVLEILAQIRGSLLIATPLALLVAVVAGLFATRRALRPLADMTESAAAISADSLAEGRLPVPSTRDEVQGLALAFNATLDRLADAFARQRRFTADASHELRTPVTAILGQAELSLHRLRTPEAYRESLARIQAEAERMQRLIGRMLALARAEGGQQVLNFAATDVAALLYTLAEAVTPDPETSPVRVHVETPRSALLVTDADCLTQIVLNLLENAIAYTERGIIEVILSTSPTGMRVEVRDRGPGIDPAHLGLIFEPFYRGDPSRQQKQGSVGLGLALTYELTQLLGGRIEAANRPDGGAVFTLTLPLTPPTRAALADDGR